MTNSTPPKSVCPNCGHIPVKEPHIFYINEHADCRVEVYRCLECDFMRWDDEDLDLVRALMSLRMQ